ncbi:universal stress protein [Pseudooceanicola sp. 216_PA32_1]|uniref:Universal stress protein n=1 Tax=Pseudooceanicola pacificus TaxID=2676438 RepID=A0A844W9M5_9RHOB|nr:universal stress protein [Pseudooceanicola pacificus]MWB79651.1 universal stress protein [Pseudooceanicola pacificus]
MPMKNLLVAFNGSDGSVAALRYAASLAERFGAHVTAMLAHSGHEVIDKRSRWIPKEARALLDAVNTDILREIEERFEAERTRLGLANALQLTEVTGRVDTVLSEAARHYDTLIVGTRSDDDDGHVTLHPDRIALLSGRPVIVVPAGYDAGAANSHIALAWDGGRAAARALSDSLRLVEDEGRVSVLTVGPRTAWPIEDLMLHLSRHGVEAIHENWPTTHPVADTVLTWCNKHAPSLLVLGAFEHSKFREDFLGGVTTDILSRTKIPVLLSH